MSKAADPSEESRDVERRDEEGCRGWRTRPAVVPKELEKLVRRALMNDCLIQASDGRVCLLETFKVVVACDGAVQSYFGGETQVGDQRDS